MSGKKRAIETDWAKVDAYELGPKDYEEIPELTDEWFDKATLHINGVPGPPGRPKAARPNQPVSLRRGPGRGGVRYDRQKGKSGFPPPVVPPPPLQDICQPDCCPVQAPCQPR